ncbi:MAG: glycosyl transferase, partial [Candidatus Cloacimonetes bacterium]|nr:glycosyl transferase [Candidatus Cloacimonadota bacterium]
INLVLYDIKLDKYDIIDSLYAYNWQQGSKLMWLNDFEFIYNNYDKKANKYISKIYNIKKKSFSIIDFPIYDTFEKTFAISINFERLNIGRADYAYKNKQTKIDWNNNSDDGLYYVDLVKNKTKLLITLEDIIKLNYKETMNDAKHKFNHIMISPDGKKIMFMHRWFTKNNRRYDTLLVSNIDGSDIRIVADDDMVSHCFWYGNNNIFAYLRDENFGDKFYMINIDTAQKKIIGKDLIDKLGDGHPTIFEDNVVFDTYPNKARMKELYLLNFKTEKLEKLGEFLEPFTYYGETRCDLHPRWSFDGKKVFFDSVHTGKRKLYWIDIENE